MSDSKQPTDTPKTFRGPPPDLKEPVKHQSMFVRVHDEETQWRVIIAYMKGVPFLPSFFRDLKSWESGGLDLFDGQMVKTQGSGAIRLDGHRYVIIWWPQEPWQVPHVYIDARVDESFVRASTKLSYCEACGKEGCTEEHAPCPACGDPMCEGGGQGNWSCIGMHYTDFLDWSDG